MSRLVAFGCSYTYGHGLPDCHLGTNLPGPKPSDLAWPSVLAKLLELEVVNRSNPGASNLHILWNLLNFKFKKDDICVVLWTHLHRHVYSVLTENPSESKWDEGGLEAMQEMQIDETNLLIKNFICINHADMHLNNLDIKHYFLFGPTMSAAKLVNACPESIRPNEFIMGVPFKGLDVALDGNHPGPKSHSDFALRIYNNINGIR